MSTGTGIEWTEATWNPIAGCTPVSPGCLNCYAATMSARLAAMGQPKYVGLTVKRDGRQVFNGKIHFDEAALSIPLKRKQPTMYFVNSMSDLFHEAVPVEFIWKVFAIMASTPWHTYQILTKRPERMAEVMTLHNGAAFNLGVLKAAHSIPGQEGISGGWSYPVPNVWLGTSCENQATADERIPHLLKCPAAIRFISAEPLLGPVRLLGANDTNAYEFEAFGMAWGDSNHQYERLREPGIHWVIVGGESGAKARPCDIEWVRSIVGQCKAAEVACFVKQLGSRPVVWDCGAGDEFMPDAPGYGPVGYHGRPLADRKGGDISEFPIDLRVREMPDAKVPA
jgi:protein gp37